MLNTAPPGADTSGVEDVHTPPDLVAEVDGLLGAGGEGGPAVIWLDLERFGEVNTALGRQAGDELLEVVAKRLRAAVRDEDLVARVGADAFVVACPRIATGAEAVRAAIRMGETVGGQVQLKAGRARVRAAVGVAWSPEGDVDGAGLLGRAEAAMHQARQRGGGRPVLASGPASERPG
ncbi:MAG TPA: GGDEF domain-containing protein [Acidimicrobiales bacterium]|nr:GGDEF domain-containing protein [Acidimicrobiales bacterium]